MRSLINPRDESGHLDYVSTRPESGYIGFMVLVHAHSQAEIYNENMNITVSDMHCIVALTRQCTSLYLER